MTAHAQLVALDDALERIERLSVSSDAGALSFGLREDVIARLESLFSQLLRAVSHYAWAETQTAITAVSYNGGMSTVWSGMLDQEQITVHVASLDQALQFRVKLFRVLIASVQAVVSISLAVVAPASALIALNSAWRLAVELQGILDVVPHQ